MSSPRGKGGVTIDIDFDALERRFSRNAGQAQCALDTQVLKDCDPYLPYDSGNLRNSGIRATKPGTGKVIWNAVYTWVQYNLLPKKSHDTHPQATMRWFEAAKAVRKEAWLRVAKRIGGQR